MTNPTVHQAPVNPAWMSDAACADVDDPTIFFPTLGESPLPAKAICASCPVKPECLAYALRWHIHFGVWGGLTEKDRRVVRRQRQAG